MKILGIETTCDETAAAVVEEGERILSNVIRSQVAIHEHYGGVYPELASREHRKNILPVIDKAFSEGGDIDAIAVAHEPGLMGPLLMGVTCAQTLSFCWNRPLIGINHIEAHLYAAMMGQEKSYPALGLVVSGGHTLLLHVESAHRYTRLSGTVDDAVGEAFDKVASMLELPYPGGPHIERLARSGNPHRFPFKGGRVKSNPLSFSFSGLKTNVRYTLDELKRCTDQDKADIAASFQRAVCDDLLTKTKRACSLYNLHTLYLGGGVAINQAIQSAFTEAFEGRVFFPPPDLCMDNGAMIAGLAYHKQPLVGETILSASPKTYTK